MGWSIPKMLDIERPKRISMRAWFSALAAISSAAAGAVLLLWPHGKPTNGIDFWILLIGSPAVASCFALGVRLSRWEGKQLVAEEAEQEQQRILSLWKVWSRRDLRVSTAVALTAVRTADFSDENARLPVNTDRTKALAWRRDTASNEAAEPQIFRYIVEKIAERRVAAREIDVTLLIDRHAAKFTEECKAFLQRALESALPDLEFFVSAEPIADSATWISAQVDRACDRTRLIVAMQLWDEEEEAHTFTEGVAALLIAPTATGESARLDDGEPAARIFRPMLSANDKVDADIAQLLDMQTAPERPVHLWHSGCGPELESAILSAVNSDPKVPVVEHAFDRAVGRPGPATSWIMLSAALEAFQHDSALHLLVWRDNVDARLNFCMIAPAGLETEGRKETT